ncbi:tetratricopeptide repeat protein [Rhodocyclus tenuis]|uniref:Tetratricopeptide repeat protein n=1 Tax=Rhodocyclus gracilis TaxID=2929842 RepID=A0ABX0WGR2_9RHOO|nr:nuclear transport factor 2 family protein [Rhodocyclus gracilis]NJA88900.1 tetratricopeptide repeat protein [Rhodocyclus gracilis]
MPPAFPTARAVRPLPSRLSRPLSALLVGLCLSVAAPFAFADDLPDAQRMLRQGQFPQALEKVDSYLSSKPKDAQGRFLRGVILTEMGRSADAIATFTRLTEDYPELPEPYNNLAVLYAQQKQYDKARTALEMAIRTHPSYAVAHENLGDIYAKLASQAYDKALQIDSSNTTAQSKLSLIRELISTSGKPGVKPTATARPAAEPVRVAATDTTTRTAPPAPVAPVPPPAPAKPAVIEKPAVKAPEKTVEKAAESRPATPARSDANTAENDINRALQGWAAAWARKDVKAYLGYYASDFQTPNGVSRKEWEAERAQRIDKPGKLQVSVEDVRVTLNGDKATVRFRQFYRSASLKSSAMKTVVLVRSGAKWLIQQERIG